MAIKKVINGLEYTWEDEFGKKTDARDEAKEFRNKGYRARVIKIKGGYAVYSRKR